MKNIALHLMLACALLTSVVSLNAINVILVRKDSASKYCFMDAKGRTYLENRFDGQVYTLGNGYFAVAGEDKKVSVYAFDKKNPRLIGEGFLSTGDFSEGLLAVVRDKNKPIEILDINGKPVLTLDTICGKRITECDPCHYGRLVVTAVDELGEKKKGMVDKTGKVILEPVYDQIFALANDLYVMQSASEKGTLFYMADGRGGYRVMKAAPGQDMHRYKEYVVLPTVTGDMLVNRNTNKTEWLPKGAHFYSCNDKLMIYQQDYEVTDSFIVVNRKSGKQLLVFDGGCMIVLTDNGFLVTADLDIEPKTSQYSIDGKFVKKTEWYYANEYNGFVVAHKLINANWDCEHYLLNSKFQPVVKNSLTDIYKGGLEPDSYEYSPRLGFDEEVVATEMIKYLCDTLIGKGEIAGRKANECDKRARGDMLPASNAFISSLVLIGDDCVIKKISISVSGSGDYDLLRELLRKKMDALFTKVNEGVYEDKGVYFRVTNDGYIYVSDSMPE